MALKEAKGIRSKKIYDAYKQFGGWWHNEVNHAVDDVNQLTDDDVIAVMPFQKAVQMKSNRDKYNHSELYNMAIQKNMGVEKGDAVDIIRLGDGIHCVVVLVRNAYLYPNRTDGWAEHYKKLDSRENNRKQMGYNWHNKEAEDIFHNPYFKRWSKEAQAEKMAKARALSQKLSESIETKLKAARKDVDCTPTENEKKANNYAHGHISINGFQISIENPKGSYRCGKDRNGKEWKQLMHNDYGYFTKTVGKDGDAIDVFIGDNFESDKIFAVDQRINGKFDETKVMFCFNNAEQAKKAYLSNYSKDWKGFWKITETDIDTFKKWLYDGHRQRKPFAEYIIFSKKKVLKEDIDKTSTEKFLRSIVDSSKNKDTSNIEFEDFFKDEYGTYVLTLSGGLNGWGEWDEYLEDILDLYEKIDEKYSVWLIDLKVDVLDDVWNLKLGIDKKNPDFKELKAVSTQ